MFIVLLSCNIDESSEINEQNNSNVENYSQVILQISDSIKSYDYLEDDKSISLLYKRNDYKLFWLDAEVKISQEGLDFLQLLEHISKYGLNRDNYNYLKLDSLVNGLKSNPRNVEFATSLDFEFTKSYCQLANHLHRGHIIENSYFTDLKTHQDTLNFDSILKKGSLITNLLAVQPQHKEYHKLQKALSKFVVENTISDTLIVIPNFRKDSIKAYEVTKEILVKKKYLTDSAKGNEIVEAVIQFQEDNGLTPDGLIGKNTTQMLEYTTSKIYFQAAITLEKWRWLESWGDHYFFANIPDFTFKVYHNDTIVIDNKTVVGTFTNQTPEIESKLSYFIVNPEWYVPNSITTKELIPKMQKDPTYLSRNNYAISTNGVSINDIDWANADPSTFNYKIKQKSGNSNALGKVKFIFDNKHSVYFHDTPSKSFFNKEIRSYSHGCVRLQDPFEVAEFVIQQEEKEGWQELLDSVRIKKITKTFTPSKIHPIHIGYFTSAGDDNKRLKTMIDIYQKNDTLLSKFKEYYFNSAN